MKYKLYEWTGKTNANLGQKPGEEVQLYLVVAEDGRQFSLVEEDDIELPKGLAPTAEFESASVLSW